MKNRPTKFQWADSEQANDRLAGCYLVHDDTLVYIEGVRGAKADCLDSLNNTRMSIAIESPGWKDYRMFPPLGWINLRGYGHPTAVHLSRRAVRNRRHGIFNDNVALTCLDRGQEIIRAGFVNLSSVYCNLGTRDAMKASYPNISEIIEKLPPGRSAASSPLVCIGRDNSGMRRVFRRNEEIGLILKDSLFVFPNMMFYMDELSAEPTFDLSSIKEF